MPCHDSDVGELDGKVALVTGAGGGMGRHVALELARRGARVIVQARSLQRAAPTVDAITQAGGTAEPAGFDLSDLAAVRQAAAEIGRRHGALHVLVNNAGIWPGDRHVTLQGFEDTWAVNTIAPFTLMHELLVPLRAGSARVVNVSSKEHCRGTIHWDDLQLERGFAPRHAYRQSKLALVMLTNELARREPRLTANSLHPGVIATDLFRNMPWIVGLCIGAFCPSPERGARTIWRLAVDQDLQGVTGRFFNRFKKVQPHAMARDPQACARLWDIVAKQCG